MRDESSLPQFPCLQGLPNGVGVMRFPDSSRYEGECMQGWFHGHGIFQTIGGMKFEGKYALRQEKKPSPFISIALPPNGGKVENSPSHAENFRILGNFLPAPSFLYDGRPNAEEHQITLL